MRRAARGRAESRGPIAPTGRLALRGLALWALLGLLAACGASPVDQMRTTQPYIVRTVHLEGVARFDKPTLLSYLHAGESSRWPWGDDVPYGPAYPAVDRQLIEQLYAAHGHYQAKVLRFEIEGPKPGENQVDLRIEVAEGPGTHVRHVRAPGDLPRSVQLPQEGDLFDPTVLSKVEGDLRDQLRARGHGYARAQARAEVDRDAHTADLELEVQAGPKLRIGEIVLEGLQGVPAHEVADEVAFAVGQPYSPELVQQIEGAVYAMDVFGSVRSLLPVEPPAEDGPVPLTVQARERAFDELKLGVGFGFQPARWEERGTLRYLHRNLFGTLTRFDLHLRAGWAQIPTALDPISTGPVVGVAPTFEKKGLLERQLRWTLAPSYDLGIEQGYRFHRLRNRLGVSRFFFGRTRAQLSYTVEYFDFFDISADLDAHRTALGRDFRDPYLLGYISADYRVYLTDDLMEPTNGVTLGLGWDMAGPFGGDFSFHRLRPKITAYWRALSWLQLSARAELGFVFTPEGGSIPISMKWYLGGADTVRGWGANRLSPQVAAGCEGAEVCKGVPVGGATLALANIEAKVPIYGPIELAAFFDAGDVQEGERALSAVEWNYSVGGGVRVATPIGRFRLDVGGRLNNPERFERESRWGLHLALGEAF